MSAYSAWFKGEPSKDRLNHADVQYAAEPRVPYLTKTSLSDETLGKSAERGREGESKLVWCECYAIHDWKNFLIVTSFEPEIVFIAKCTLFYSMEP